MPTALFEHLLDLVLLAKALGAANELDLQTILRRQPFGVFAPGVALGLRPARVVEEAPLMGVEIARHPFGVTQAGQCALNQNTVIAAKYAGDLRAPAFGQQF
jgi:hypothetical protein